MTVQINVNRTGFPIKIGSIELWFDSSIENLRRFFSVEELAQEKLKKAQEKAKHIHFPDDLDLDSFDIDELEVKNVDAAIDFNKEFIAAQYDIIFGDGTFKKIYKQYPDIIALESALDPLGAAIAERIGEMEEERTEKIEAKKNEYLKKKAQKK